MIPRKRNGSVDGFSWRNPANDPSPRYVVYRVATPPVVRVWRGINTRVGYAAHVARVTRPRLTTSLRGRTAATCGTRPTSGPRVDRATSGSRRVARRTSDAMGRDVGRRTERQRPKQTHAPMTQHCPSLFGLATRDHGGGYGFQCQRPPCPRRKVLVLGSRLVGRPTPKGAGGSWTTGTTRRRCRWCRAVIKSDGPRVTPGMAVARRLPICVHRYPKVGHPSLGDHRIGCEAYR